MAPIIGIMASQISGHLWPANSYESIVTTTVGSGGSSSVTFSSIPQTYTHLQLRVVQKCVNAAMGASNAYGYFNSDTTAANYYTHSSYANISDTNSGGSNSSATATGFLDFAPDSGQMTNKFGVAVVDILNYTNTNFYKTTRTLSAFYTDTYSTNGYGWIRINSMLWKNSSAINSLTISFSDGNIAENSQFALYGVK